MENRNRTIDLIVIIVTALIMLAVMAFTLGNLSQSGNAWTISPSYNEADEEYLGESVILQKEGTVDRIFVKIGNVYRTDKDGNLVFTLDRSSSATQVKKYLTYIAANREKVVLSPKTSNGFAPGWYLLKDNLDLSDTFIKLTTEQSFDFEEVALVDKDNKILKASCFGGFDAGQFFAADEKSDTFAMVADAQHSFAFDTKRVLSDKEESLLLTAGNLYSFNDYYLSGQFTPIGSVISGIGSVLFGNSPFGLRFISFIFSFATFISVYFFAKKLFNGYKYGIIAEVAWFLSGIGLAIGGVAGTTSIALFFVIQALSFAYDFYKEKKDSFRFANYKKLIVAGALFALGGAIDIFALAALPVAVLFSLIKVIGNIKPLAVDYKSASGLEKEFIRERYIKTVAYSIVGLVVAFIVLPLLCLLTSYGLFYNLYSSYYGVSGVFAVMFANLSEIIANNNGSLAIGWLIGLGSERQSGVAERVLSANKGLVVISFALSVLYAVLFVLTKKNKLKNSRLAVAINEDFGALYVLSAFVITFLFGFLGGIKADYSTFAYSLLFMILALPYSYKLFNGKTNSLLFGITLTSIIVIVSVFFCLSAVCFLGITIPESVSRYLYGWTL